MVTWCCGAFCRRGAIQAGTWRHDETPTGQEQESEKSSRQDGKRRAWDDLIIGMKELMESAKVHGYLSFQNQPGPGGGSNVDNPLLRLSCA